VKSISVVVVQRGVPVGSPYSFIPTSTGITGATSYFFERETVKEKLYVSVLSIP